MSNEKTKNIKRKSKKFGKRVDQLKYIISANKIGNYASTPLKLLSFIIVKYKGETKIILDRKKSKWLKNNFSKLEFIKSLNFLKQKDILQLQTSAKESTYKINYKYLKQIIAKELDLKRLLKLNRYIKFTQAKITSSKKMIFKKCKSYKSIYSNKKGKSKIGRTKSCRTCTLNEDCPKYNKAKKMGEVSRTLGVYYYTNNTFKKGQKKETTKETKKGNGIKDFKELKQLQKERFKKTNTTRRKDSTELYGHYNFNPSENPKLNSWRSREIENWRTIDFLG